MLLSFLQLFHIFFFKGEIHVSSGLGFLFLIQPVIHVLINVIHVLINVIHVLINVIRVVLINVIHVVLINK